MKKYLVQFRENRIKNASFFVPDQTHLMNNGYSQEGPCGTQKHYTTTTLPHVSRTPLFFNLKYAYYKNNCVT